MRYPNQEKMSTEDILRLVEDVKSQWMTTIDALIDPLMIVTKDYEIHRANKALTKNTEKDVREVLKDKCYKVFANQDSPCPGCKIQETIDKKQDMTYQLECADKIWEVRSQPFLDTDGSTIGAVQVYRDRTEAIKMQEQLSRGEKLASIGLLAGGVAHEINNPLGGILIFSQMMLREMDKNDAHYQDIVEIEAATQRCKAIVDSLLDYARVEPAGRKKEPFSIKEAIRKAVNFASLNIKTNESLKIKVDLPEKEHAIKGDRNKLTQVFLNLINNGLQAMPDGGDLTIKGEISRRDGTTIVTYRVSDTGVGIKKEYLKKIFDPFFTTKDPGQGTGLGLALCHSIIQDLGGTLEVESELFEGSTFTVTLPIEVTSGLKEVS